MYQFFGDVITWWETLDYKYDTQCMHKGTFERLFREVYFNAYYHQAVINDFEDLHQGDMIVTKYYNWFMVLAQYFLVGATDTLLLILKFLKWLWQLIVDKIVEHYFSSLVDYYTLTLHIEANIKVMNVDCARARNLGNSRKMTHKRLGN